MVLQHHFLALPKSSRGHVRGRALVARVESELCLEDLYSPVCVFYTHCFNNWGQFVQEHYQWLSIDRLPELALAWESEQAHMNAFRYPAKMLYNDCIRVYISLAKQGVCSGSGAVFLLHMRQLMGEMWDDDLEQPLTKLHDSLDRLNSATYLLSLIFNATHQRLRPLITFVPGLSAIENDSEHKDDDPQSDDEEEGEDERFSIRRLSLSSLSSLSSSLPFSPSKSHTSPTDHPLVDDSTINASFVGGSLVNGPLVGGSLVGSAVGSVLGIGWATLSEMASIASQSSVGKAVLGMCDHGG